MKNLVFLLVMFSHLSWAEDYTLETVAEGLNHPWSVTFLPDGDYLVAFRVGEVRRISAAGEVGEAIGNAPETYFAGQGGFFDVILDPDFATNQIVYLSYAGGTPDSNGTTIMKARLDANEFKDAETIFSATPKDTPQHYGGKMIFLSDNTLMLTTGDGFEYREAAQDKQSQLGKIIRLHRDGSVPSDNPFSADETGNPFVYSYGHRNPQGLVMAANDQIYLHEHGPKGGDEVNLVSPGSNYGWPAVTHGENYSGAYVSPLKQAPGITEPKHVWVPSIAPSGMAYYSGQMFPEWQGNLFVGALVDQEVRMLELSGEKVINETTLFKEIGERIRDIRQGPNGELYIVTDGENGKIVRVSR